VSCVVRFPAASSRAATFVVSPSASVSRRAPAPISPTIDGSRVDADARGERTAEPLAQRAHTVDRGEARAQRPLGVVVVRLRVAEVGEDAVAQVLRDVALVAADRLAASVVVAAHHLAELLDVDLLGQRRRRDEVAEHDRQLTPFGVLRLSHWWRWVRPRRGRKSPAAVAAEALGAIVLRPAGGAPLGEAATALRAEAAPRTIAVTARWTGNFRLRLHGARAPGDAADSK